MKRKLLLLLLAAAILFSLSTGILAAEQSYVFDDTGVFTENQLAALSDRAEQFASEYDFHVCYLRVENTTAYEGYSSLYDLLKGVYMRYFDAQKGMILGYDVTDGAWNVYVSDDAKPLFTADEIHDLRDTFISSETYVEGYENYLTAVGDILSSGKDLSPEGSTPKSTDRLNDMAGLLSDAEADEIRAMLNEISAEHEFDLAIVTTDYLGGKYYVDYADDYYDYNHFGYGENRDGAVMLISVEPDHRICYISTCGRGLHVLSDDRIDSMLDEIVDEHLKYGEYYEAMQAFANRADRYLTPMPLSQLGAIWAAICAAFALIVGAIRLGVLKSAMKSVRYQAAANSYISGDLNVTRANDLFLYRTISRTRRESSSSSGSSHTSSSGTSHGGGGRSF